MICIDVETKRYCKTTSTKASSTRARSSAWWSTKRIARAAITRIARFAILARPLAIKSIYVAIRFVRSCVRLQRRRSTFAYSVRVVLLFVVVMLRLDDGFQIVFCCV